VHCLYDINIYRTGYVCPSVCFNFLTTREIFTFGCCILLRIYPTGSLWRRQSQQSFNTSTPPFYFSFYYMFRPLRAIFRWDIQLDVSKDYSYFNGSAVCTQLDVCLYRYFYPRSSIHVIKLSIKIVKTLIFTVKLVSYIKYKNIKMLKYQGEWAFISS
jgi:hypothetical protein